MTEQTIEDFKKFLMETRAIYIANTTGFPNQGAMMKIINEVRDYGKRNDLSEELKDYIMHKTNDNDLSGHAKIGLMSKKNNFAGERPR